MWSSLLVPLPADAQPYSSAPHDAAGAAPPGASDGLPSASPHGPAPVRAAGWRRWLPDWRRGRAASRR